MNLQESIRRILREGLYSPAGEEYKPARVVIHTSNPVSRDNIKLKGLQVSVGECYQVYVNRNETNPDKIKCKKAIFATDSLKNRDMFNSTYDDDIWLINTECANVKWYKDKHFDYPDSKHIVTFENISPECIKLIHKGTGKSEDSLQESDPKTGTGKKPKGSGRRLYTDENPNDTVSVKFRTKEDIIDTLNKDSFKSKPHKRQSQIINLIHQRVRAAYQNAKDPETKKRLKRAYDYIENKKEESKQKTIKLRNMNEEIEKPQYQIRRERIQKLVNDILNDMKLTCEIMNSEDDEIISFGACDLIDADVKVSVSDVGIVNGRRRVLVVIKYHNWRYIDEDEFVYELSKELRKWIGDNYVEVEDYINTFPPEKRQ